MCWLPVPPSPIAYPRIAASIAPASSAEDEARVVPSSGRGDLIPTLLLTLPSKLTGMPPALLRSLPDLCLSPMRLLGRDGSDVCSKTGESLSRLSSPIASINVLARPLDDMESFGVFGDDFLRSRSLPPSPFGFSRFRLRVACSPFQWFLTALSVLPGKSLAISAHRLPISLCRRTSF